jgi:hypothetical protein
MPEKVKIPPIQVGRPVFFPRNMPKTRVSTI